eukprot:scaffold51652_cov32-Attheya_sp.AAC.1
MSKKSKCLNVNLTRSSGIKPWCSNYGRYRHAFYRRHGIKNSTHRSSQQIYNRQRIWKAPVEEGNESETECLLLTSEKEQEAESSDEEEEASIAATPVYAAVCNPQIDLLEAEVSRLKSELEKWKKKKKKKPSQGTAPNQEDVPKKNKKKQSKKEVNDNLVLRLKEVIMDVLTNERDFNNLGGNE